MSFKIPGQQTAGYHVKTEVYKGPLDLLLELIERSELDITKLALAQVTDQYLEYLQNLKDRDPAEVSAFLVIAARLVQIKSSALLPTVKVDDPLLDEEDPGEALARQLILYKRFKELASNLQEYETEGKRTFLRIAYTPPKVEAKLDLSGITIDNLLSAAQSVFSSTKKLPTLSKVVNLPRITIREKISTILTSLRSQKTTTFRKLIRNPNRIEVVVSFLAMLELIKRRVVEAQQEQIFGDIEIKTLLENLEEADNIEVEFKDS